MYLVAISCFYVLTIFSQTYAIYQLPSFITTCRRADPELSKCWRSSVEKLRPYLEVGIPEFNLPRINHWSIPSKFRLTAETFYEDVEDVTYRGAENFVILDNTINLEDNLITLKLRFPKLFFDILSTVNGTVFNYHFNNKGHIEGNIDEIILDYKLKGHRMAKKEQEFILFEDKEVNVQFQKYTLTAITYFESQEENEKFIGECTKYHNAFDPLVKQVIMETLSPAIFKILKFVYDNYPLSVLHPLH